MTASPDTLSSKINSASQEEKAAMKDQKTPASPVPKGKKPVKEIGGPKGPEPTRYGDWERNGRCSDF